MEERSDLSFFQESKDEEIESKRGERNSDTIPPYSEREALVLEERLNNKKTFKEALQVLIAWLEKGQCNERNSLHFYSLIQICWNNVEKLLTAQKECLEEAQKVQESVVRKISHIPLQLSELEKVFKAIEKKNIQDNFTQNQVEKILEMRKGLLDFKINSAESSIVGEEESSVMKNVNDEAAEAENKRYEDPKKGCKCENEISELKSELERSRKFRKENNSISVGSQCDLDQVHQTEMHIISLISTFLFRSRDGVNIHDIYSLLSNSHITTMGASEIENFMRRFPAIFKESSPIATTEEKKWTLSVSQEHLSAFRNKQ